MTRETSTDALSRVVMMDLGPEVFGEFETSRTSRSQMDAPGSILSRIARRRRQRRSTQRIHFIRELREAFDKSDTRQVGRLTLDQWRASTLRMVIREDQISEDEYEKYFYRIDADFDGEISWSELVHYLMKEISGVDLGKNNDVAQFIQKSLTPPHARHHMHREMVSQVVFCSRTCEYITLSSDSIRFWSPADLTFRRAILEPGLFGAMVAFENSLVLAVGTTNRRLIFFDLDNLVPLPVEVAASPSANTIHQMTKKDAERALEVLDSPMIPMFNVPTAMLLADVYTSEARLTTFFVGDDQGVIEVYEIRSPQRRNGKDYQIERIARKQMHQGSITQISRLDMPNMYASSGWDNTVKFWSFNTGPPLEEDPFANKKKKKEDSDEEKGHFKVVKVFTDDGPISSFVYSELQKVLATCGIGRDAFIWSISPAKKIAKLSGHYNMLAKVLEYETTKGDRYLMTMTVKKEFRLWDSVNYRLVREWTDPAVLRPENKYSAAMFDYKRHALITAGGDVVKWCEDINAVNEAEELRTHNRQIVGCLYSRQFRQIVTVDSRCGIKVWSIEQGKNTSNHQEPWYPNSSDIATATLDCAGRRMLTSSFKNDVLLWNYNSGTVMADLKLAKPKSLITHMIMSHINGRDFLIRAGWDKTITLFTEFEASHFEPYREFKAHTDDISAILGLPTGLLSASVNGELFFWSLDTSAPIAGIKLNPVACIECLAVFEQHVFFGDSNGYLHIALLPKLKITDTVAAHSIIVPHALSAIYCDAKRKFLYTADTLGYVKKWRLLINDNTVHLDVVGHIVRCHNDEITAILVVNDGRFVVTCGVDMMVRVWSAETFEFVGFFSDESSWDIYDPDTWAKDAGFEVDPKHFEKKGLLQSSSRKSVGSVLGSLKNITLRDMNPIAAPIAEQPAIIEEEPEQEKPLDVEDFWRLVDEYSQQSATSQARRTELRYKLNAPPTFVFPQLQPSMRPCDLLSTIGGLITRGPPNKREHKRVIQTAIPQKRTCRMPIPLLPERKMYKRKVVPSLVTTAALY